MTLRFEDLFSLCDGEYELINKLEAILIKTLKNLTRNDPQPYTGDYWISKTVGCGWYFHVSDHDRNWKVEGGGLNGLCVNSNVLSMVASTKAFQEFAVTIDKPTLQEEVIWLVKNILIGAMELSIDELRIFNMLID